MSHTAFDDLYAAKYDALYGEKDYHGEVAYLEEIWDSLDARPESVLDLGCGTGSHGELLAARGHEVLGVDRSDAMVRRAEEKIRDRGLGDRFSVVTADLTEIDLGRQFDAVTSLFTVFGYLTSLDRLKGAFEAVRCHLRPGGTFLFDTWYGPAVLRQGPEARLRRVDDGEGTLYRFTKASLDSRRQTVTVRFDLIHVDDAGHADERSETHTVRYFFEPEIELLAEMADLSFLDAHPFRARGDDLGEDTWNVTWVLRRPD